MKEGAGAPRLSWVVSDIGAGDGELPSDDSCHTDSMKGSRTAAMLCVLLGHALIVLALRDLTSHRPESRAAEPEEFVTVMVMPIFDIDDRELIDRDKYLEHLTRLPSRSSEAPSLPDDAGEGTGETADSPRGFIDWPVEGRKTAERIVAEQIEAERVAKMFAGPQGTWASLTKRQQSELEKFRWKPGVDGLERDERGNTIYRLNNRCVLVNFMFIGCALGAKPPAYGDLFKDMRKYFDEQRLPQTDEGNGREPESMRPPYWSKPLPERER